MSGTYACSDLGGVSVENESWNEYREVKSCSLVMWWCRQLWIFCDVEDYPKWCCDSISFM